MNPKGAASQNFQLPKRVRLNNLFDRLFKQKELLTLDGILDSVRKRSELTDWGDPGFLEALQAQVHSYNTETDATPFSHGAFKRSCVSKIMLRCQLVDWWKRHPEILEQPVQRPIFVTGMPRTGTTFLHRLLSQDPNNRPLLYWEQQWPTPPPQPETYQTDERIKWAKRSRDGLFTLAPELEAIHPMEAQGPEECNGLFDPEFANMATAGLNHMPSFVEWILKRDMTQTYKFYRGELQLLNWKMPPKRWCLKSPSHLYFLDALLAVFPDASIIWNHRPPEKTLASGSSLVYIYRKISTGRAFQGIGREMADGLLRSVERAMETRKTANPQRFFDMSYRKLVEDPIGMVHSIYEHFGYNYSPEFEAAMHRWIKANRQHKHGVHRYHLKDFGLSREWIDNRFSNYLSTYASWL